MKTLADEPGLMYELRVHQDSPFDPACSTTEVFAPCCRRRAVADAILDVRDVKDTIVRGGGYQDPKDHDWLCDGCRDRMLREPSNGWTAVKLFEQCGAPAETIRSLKIREQLDDMARLAAIAAVAFDPTQAEALAIVAVDAAQPDKPPP